jgi:histone-lysine N-methyltransferase SETD1
VSTHRTSRSPSPEPTHPEKKLEKVRLLCESNTAAKIDLKATLAADIRSRIAEPHIYSLLAPGRLEVRKKPEESDSGAIMDTASTPACDSPLPPPFVAASLSEVQPLPANLITNLPRFKKHKPKRPETPTSNAAHLSNGKRNEEARPLAHRLNHYDGSDDESTTTDQRPVSRGSLSRAFSTDIGDDDSVSLAPSSLDIRTRKRKRSIGARTPSRLKDAAISTDDEDDEAVETTSPEQEADLMEVDEPDEPDELCPHDFITDVDSEEHASRKKLRKVAATKLASDDLNQREILDEDEGVDITSLDDSKETDLCQRLSDEKTEAAIDLFLDQIEAEKDGPQPAVDMSWSISSTDLPRVTVEEDTDMIMDLDGLQAVIMDDEDLRLLKSALEDTPPAEVGNVYLWACKMKECKVANREGKRGKKANHTLSASQD